MTLKETLELIDLRDKCKHKIDTGKCSKECRSCKCDYEPDDLHKGIRENTEECWQTLKKAWKQGIIRL